MAKAKKENKNTWGGDRGGRKPFKYGEPTTPMRIPNSLVPVVLKLIADKFKK